MPEISIRPPGGTVIQDEDLLPAGRHRARVAEIVMVDNPWAQGETDPRKQTRLRILFEATSGKHKGKMISTYSSPSMYSKVTKAIIVQLFGREPSPQELSSIDTDRLIEEADNAGRNAFLLVVVPHTRKDGTPTVKLENIVGLGEEENEEDS